MRSIANDAARPLPGWMRLGVNLIVVTHLVILGAFVLAGPSGPWNTPFGISFSPGPTFASPIANSLRPLLHEPLRMTHTYRFEANQVDTPGVYFEVHLKDDQGKALKTVRIPDKGAAPWVRHRQQLLALRLFADGPVEDPGSEAIPAPNKKLELVSYWEPGPTQMTLKQVPLHLVPRGGQAQSPSPWSVVLAQSYVRYLCRAHRAASGELVRHTRPPVLPSYLFTPDVPPMTFEDLRCSFGEIRRDQ